MFEIPHFNEILDGLTNILFVENFQVDVTGVVDLEADIGVRAVSDSDCAVQFQVRRIRPDALDLNAPGRTG